MRSTIGSVAGQQERIAAASGAVHADERLADRQQTLADADQAGSNRDQTAADNDQAAADSDQAASDRGHEHGGDAETYHLTRGLRDRSTRQRQQGTDGRFEVAAARDAAAHARDLIASERDEAAAMRDWQLARRDADDVRVVTASEIGARAAETRERAAEDRAAAAKGRERSAGDRAKAARDRAQAAHDRMQAQADRAELLHQLAIAETDALTGARTRAAGLSALGRAIDRAREKKASLVAAYVEVIGLRAANSAHGHAAGDVLLQRTGRAVRGRVRSSDLVVRLGDDGFLCATFGETLANARLRFESVRAALADDPYPCEIEVGLAALAPGDSVEGFIERAAPRCQAPVATSAYAPTQPVRVRGRARRPTRRAATTRAGSTSVVRDSAATRPLPRSSALDARRGDRSTRRRSGGQEPGPPDRPGAAGVQAGAAARDVSPGTSPPG